MWLSPQGWWVKERGEVRDWGQAHWSASFFQRHSTTMSNMLQDIRKCGRMTRRCCWLERLCSSASPPPLKPGYKRQESAADDEEGKRRLLSLTLWEGGELDARGGATGVWLPPTHVGVLARGGKLWICIQVRNPQNCAHRLVRWSLYWYLDVCDDHQNPDDKDIGYSNVLHIVQPCSWGKSPWFPRSWSPCTSPCWQEQMKPFKFHFVGRSAPQFHTSLSIELILEHKSLQKSPNTLALNFDSLDFWA